MCSSCAQPCPRSRHVATASNKGGGPLTGTLSVETGSLKFTSGTYSKGFEVKTDGTVGAIQVDVNYKGSEPDGSPRK